MRKSLYQKYRPQSFAEVVGQHKIIKTLKNSLKSGNVGHAYLFSGPRGTGKTTLARILAKTVNCSNPINNDSCLNCQNCQAAQSGRLIDIIEVDAASNRGIDEIRDLREKVKFAPNSSRFKVYIIDEVHMLTKEAFNALLKTLEEPPNHVIFILATTEIHKLPATILSRVQRFDFGRVTTEEIEENLKKIIDQEKLEVDQSAVKLLARKAEGSHRDAISLLEQVKSYAPKISLKEVEEILGIAGSDLVIKLLVLAGGSDRRAMLTTVDEYLTSGYDAGQLALSLAEMLRQIVFVKAGVESGVYLNQNETKALSPLLDLSISQLTRAMEIILNANREIKNSPMPALILTIALSDVLEIWAEGGKLKVDQKKLSEKPDIVIQEKQEQNRPETNRGKVSDQELNWPEVLNLAKTKNHTLSALLRDIKPSRIDGDKVILTAKFKFHADKVSEAKNRALIEGIIGQVVGRDLTIECHLVDQKTPKTGPKEDLVKAAEEIFN